MNIIIPTAGVVGEMTLDGVYTTKDTIFTCVFETDAGVIFYATAVLDSYSTCNNLLAFRVVSELIT